MAEAAEAHHQHQQQEQRRHEHAQGSPHSTPSHLAGRPGVRAQGGRSRLAVSSGGSAAEADASASAGVGPSGASEQAFFAKIAAWEQELVGMLQAQVGGRTVLHSGCVFVLNVAAAGYMLQEWASTQSRDLNQCSMLLGCGPLLFASCSYCFQVVTCGAWWYSSQTCSDQRNYPARLLMWCSWLCWLQDTPVSIRAIIATFKDRILTERDKTEFKGLCDKWTSVVEWPAGTKCLQMKSWMRGANFSA